MIGPSGAGKTTLLQMLALALRPASGHLTLDGENPWMLATSRLQKLRGQIFYAPQTPPLPPRQRVVTSLLAGRLPALSLMQSLLQLILHAIPTLSIQLRIELRIQLGVLLRIHNITTLA